MAEKQLAPVVTVGAVVVADRDGYWGIILDRGGKPLRLRLAEKDARFLVVALGRQLNMFQSL